MTNPECSGVQVFRFVPLRYATAERFARPRLVSAAGAEQSSGQICPQLPGRLVPVMGVPKAPPPQGEDCLNLAITTPGRDGDRPVMVFLHGGAFVSGGGLLDWYDGSALSAETDVVVVSVNYRIGVLGYLCLDGISEGNLGLLDQLAALQWVRDNIAAYGGDPSNVTVVGQSAGAVSIRLLMAMPAAQGLFRRAILQSGPGNDVGRPRESAEAIGQVFADHLGEDPRTAQTTALLAAQQATTTALQQAGDIAVPAFYPVLGTDVLPSTVDGFGANVEGMEVICGWNADDVSAFTGPGPHACAATTQILAAPTHELATQLNDAGARAWTYQLDWRPVGSPFGATHCVELPLLLGTQTAWEPCPMLGDTPWEQVDVLGRTLRRAWGHFARTGEILTEAMAPVPLQWNPEVQVIGA